MPRVRTHPGEVLREEFLVPLEMSAHQLAEAIDVPPNRISEIVREARSVTADTALRLAGHFNTTPEFWLNLQMAHDLSKAIAEAPARRYVTGRVIEHRIVKRPVTGEWTKRDAASGSYTKAHGGRTVTMSSKTDAKLRGGDNKPSSKGDKQHPKHKK